MYDAHSGEKNLCCGRCLLGYERYMILLAALQQFFESSGEAGVSHETV